MPIDSDRICWMNYSVNGPMRLLHLHVNLIRLLIYLVSVSFDFGSCSIWKSNLSARFQCQLNWWLIINDAALLLGWLRIHLLNFWTNLISSLPWSIIFIHFLLWFVELNQRCSSASRLITATARYINLGEWMIT